MTTVRRDKVHMKFFYRSKSTLGVIHRRSEVRMSLTLSSSFESARELGVVRLSSESWRSARLASNEVKSPIREASEYFFPLSAAHIGDIINIDRRGFF